MINTAFLKYFVSASICVGAISYLPPLKAAEPTAPINAARQVGALAWIEPQSHIIRIGAPNIMEGARVENLNVQVGQTVKQGELLGTFSTYLKNKAAVDVAEASLKLANANLARVKAGSKRSDIAAQSQRVDSLAALENAAKLEFDRISSLYEQNLIAKSAYDTSNAELNKLRADRKTAQAELESLSTVRVEDIRSAEAEVAIANSKLALAQRDVELSSIVAPIDGTILTIYTRKYEAVGDNPVLDIADLNSFDAVAEIDEADILSVQLNQKALIMINGIDEPVKGIVREISGQIRKNTVLDSNPSQRLDTRIVEVRIALDKNKNDILKRLVNMKVKATILP